MGYLDKRESQTRIRNVRKIMAEKNLDAILVYYDEFNIGNGWYLTGWCPQFESGAVLVPREGAPLILGGPESEPFARLDSAITDTRNFPVFMVPNEEYPNATITDFKTLFEELKSRLGKLRAIGLVGGGRIPADCHRQIMDGFKSVRAVDITDDYVRLRYIKSEWEAGQIRAAFKLAEVSYAAMKKIIAPGVTEIEVAAAGEYAARRRSASGFGFAAIVGSGPRSNAVVPTASSKKMAAGEMVMIGIAPKVMGYAGVVGDLLPVTGKYTARQKECRWHLKEAFCLTRQALAVGKTGREIDAPARAYFQRKGLSKYLVCPFVHTIGLHEAESPFFGPNSDDILQPGMTVCVDVSFFGHPDFYGARIETGYEIKEHGAVPLSPKMDRLLTQDKA